MNRVLAFPHHAHGPDQAQTEGRWISRVDD